MVYVDKIFDTSPYKNVPRCMRGGACHMWADMPDELMNMARRIGLKLEWVQNSGLDTLVHGKTMHFDLTPKKRIAALMAGAVEASFKEHCRKILIERGLIPKDENHSR